MESLAGNLVTLVLLVLLQAVLGFDNLLYISLESGRAPADKQKMVRQLGIGIAILFRIALLFILLRVIQFFQDPIFSLNLGFIDGTFNVHSLIVLLGGVFIMYTAVREITHMMSLEVHDHEETKPKSVAAVIAMIVLMNLVFSFDSILSAMALSDTFWVMASAIVLGGVLMIVLSDRVANFLKKNRLYEVLGLFVLFIVGIMLLTEGAHLAHMHLFGTAITPMTKVTFYFVLVVLVLVDIVQGRYQRKLILAKEHQHHA